MKIWLVTIGEPIPVQEGVLDRPHRTGYFAYLLANQGHNVVWWTSTFDHFRKKHLFEDDTFLSINEHLQIKLLYGCGYRTNVSFSRIRDHKHIANKFSKLIRESEDKPDIIEKARESKGSKGKARGQIFIVEEQRMIKPQRTQRTQRIRILKI